MAIAKVLPITRTTSIPKTPRNKKQREHIHWIERRPQPEWFLRQRDEWGRVVWYMRLEVTGLLPRRFGPFASRQKALLFLDRALDDLLEMLPEAANHAQDYIEKRVYRARDFAGQIIEDQVGWKAKKGR